MRGFGAKSNAARAEPKGIVELTVGEQAAVGSDPGT
jgi:hypothetical protein